VKFAFIAAEKASYPVRVLCRTLEVSRAGFYAWHTRPAAARTRADHRLGVEIKAIHAETRQRYGSPRVHAELRDRGHRVGRKRVARLMRQHGLCARRRRRFRVTTDSNHPLPVAANVLGRQFTVVAPDTAWVTDITYLWTREGWLYLAVILDLFSRAVVGWAMSAQITTQHLTLQALKMALGRRRPPQGLLHHSDRGSQYASADYQRTLTAYGIVGSMSRRGNCWDNAVAESFFATIKVELVHDTDWTTRGEARGEVFEYLEGFYNGQRRHSTLGYLSPLAFEQQWAAERGRTPAAAPTPFAGLAPQHPSSVEALGSILTRGAAISVSPSTTLMTATAALPGILEPAPLISLATSVPGPTTP
jgi:transposase InsO family protein